MFIASAPDFNIAVGNELKNLKYKIYIIEIHIKSGELYHLLRLQIKDKFQLRVTFT